MAKIRNLKYEGQIVEQPVHDNTPLIKWIHDGVVVWENGGAFKNVLISSNYKNSDALKYVFALDVKNKKAYAFAGNDVYGFTDECIYQLHPTAYYGSYYYMTDDYTQKPTGDYPYMGYVNVVAVGSDKLIAEYNQSIIEVVIKNLRIDSETELSTFEIGDKFSKINLIGSAISNPAPLFFAVREGQYLEENPTVNYWVSSVQISAFNAQGNEIIIKSTEYRERQNYVSESYGEIINARVRLECNNKSFLFLNYINKPTISSVAITYLSVIKADANNIEYIQHELVYPYANADNVRALKHIKSTNAYYIFFANGNNMYIHRTNENLEILGLVTTLPDYMDIPIINGSNYEFDYVRLYFNDNGIIAEDRHLLAHPFNSLLQTVNYDDNGNASDSETIEISVSYSIYRPYIYVHIDNILFNQSENNYAAYCE